VYGRRVDSSGGSDPGKRAAEGLRAVLGRHGEEAALSAYRRSGFTLVARNWRCPAGELDLVLARGGLLVFCEVKTRGGGAFGGGHEAVTWRKQRKLRQLAEIFLAGFRTAPSAVRFDVASVMVRPGSQPSVELFEDAF
jgi:putative endonuclease